MSLRAIAWQSRNHAMSALQVRDCFVPRNDNIKAYVRICSRHTYHFCSLLDGGVIL